MYKEFKETAILKRNIVLTSRRSHCVKNKEFTVSIGLMLKDVPVTLIIAVAATYLWLERVWQDCV